MIFGDFWNSQPFDHVSLKSLDGTDRAQFGMPAEDMFHTMQTYASRETI